VLALVEGAHQDGAPLVLTQEVHRLASVDFGRELDPGTASKVRRASRSYPSCATSLARTSCASAAAFFATDLDLLLRGLGVRTVVACGYLTDVCVHYTCVDAHERGLTDDATESAAAAPQRARRSPASIARRARAWASS